MGGVHLPSRSLPLSPFTFPASPFILPVLPMSDPLIDRLKILIVATLKLEGVRPEEIPDDEPLIGSPRFGLDSIDALELVLALKKKYGIVIEAGDESSRQHLRSVATLAALIASRQ